MPELWTSSGLLLFFRLLLHRHFAFLRRRIFVGYAFLPRRVIILQKADLPAFGLIGDDRIEADIFHAAEDMRLHLRIALFQLADELLDLLALRLCLLVGAAGRAGIGEFAGALDKMQIVRVAPRLDIVLADQIERPDQLHALKIRAVEFRHHGLDLRAPEHPHQNGLDHVVVMMAQRDLVAAELLRVAVEIAPPHPRAEIARRFFHVVDRVKNVGFKDLDRDMEPPRVFLDDLAVGRTVARVHHDKAQLKREFIVQLQFLKKLRHQHGVLTAGDADRDAVARLD